MIRYLLVIIFISLVGCSIDGVEITGVNNLIDTPHYSITVPPNRRWHLNKDVGDPDISEMEKTVGPDFYIMRFSTNWVVDESMKSLTAKQVADEYRNGEQANMIVMGVMSGLYELEDVMMGEEKVENKKFYTMNYTIIADGIKQRSSLYLYFPKEHGFTRFFVSVYSEAFPLNKTVPNSLKSDFLEILGSLEMAK